MDNGLVLEGKIEAGDYEKLRSAYRKKTNEFYIGGDLANEIYLASPGGDLAEAMKIGRLVRELKLHTVVPAGPYPLPGTYVKYSAADRHQLKNPQENFMCTSACFFIFAAGITRELGPGASKLGIHKPYLSDTDLRTLNGDQAITSANRVRSTVENYLKEMNVPTKYVELMFSVPKDKIAWLENVADLEGTIPELTDWLDAQCDKRTDVERAVWEKTKRLTRPSSPVDQLIWDKILKKMTDVSRCKSQTLEKLAGSAWVAMFDPTCANIAFEARSLAVERGFCPP